MPKHYCPAVPTQGDKLWWNYAFKKWRHQTNMLFPLLIMMQQSTFPVFHLELTKTLPSWQLSGPNNFGSES